MLVLFTDVLMGASMGASFGHLSMGRVKLEDLAFHQGANQERLDKACIAARCGPQKVTKGMRRERSIDTISFSIYQYLLHMS